MPEHPWKQRTRERAVAYEAFIVYRDLGSDRSLANVGKTLGKSLALCSRWSFTWDWVGRAKAWDIHLQSERDKAALAEARKWEERRIQAREANFDMAQRLRERASELLRHPIVRARGKGPDGAIVVEPAGWRQDTIAVLAKLAADLESASIPQASKDTTIVSPAKELARAIQDAMQEARDAEA